jgi:hypothetical protein
MPRQATFEPSTTDQQTRRCQFSGAPGSSFRVRLLPPHKPSGRNPGRKFLAAQDLLLKGLEGTPLDSAHRNSLRDEPRTRAGSRACWPFRRTRCLSRSSGSASSLPRTGELSAQASISNTSEKRSPGATWINPSPVASAPAEAVHGSTQTKSFPCSTTLPMRLSQARVASVATLAAVLELCSTEK